MSAEKEYSLTEDPGLPMIGMVSRLVDQKGLDIILDSLPAMLKLPLQVIILGTGDTHYELKLKALAKAHPEKFKVIIGYDEALSHQIEGGSDMYLMPSTFEPCGLNQLYSLRYGTLPIATSVGGLADTVIDATEENIKNETANGFVLKTNTSKSLVETVKHALTIYQDTSTWKKMQLTAMSQDYSWQASAENYISLYGKAINSIKKK